MNVHRLKAKDGGSWQQRRFGEKMNSHVVVEFAVFGFISWQLGSKGKDWIFGAGLYLYTYGTSNISRIIYG